MEHSNNTQQHNLGTWAFLKPGWWIVHLIGVAVLVWLAMQVFAY